jgi:hypothetical protein
MSRSWLNDEPNMWRMFCDVCFDYDARACPDQPDLGLFAAEGWFIGRRVDACPACVAAGNTPSDDPHPRYGAVEPADARMLPPMWGLWLLDPSGKYGRHKPFYEHAETAEAAVASAIARYQVSGVTVDPIRKPFLAQEARLPLLKQSDI